MRHGPAEDDSPTGRDEDRALTERGRERVRGVVQLLVREGELPGRVISSHLVRARETADIVVSGLAHHAASAAKETALELAPGGRSLDLARRVEARGVATMVVGHEPDLSALVAELLGDAMPLPMDKAMVVALDLSGNAPASLRFIVEPRALTMVHDRRR